MHFGKIHWQDYGRHYHRPPKQGNVRIAIKNLS